MRPIRQPWGAPLALLLVLFGVGSEGPDARDCSADATPPTGGITFPVPDSCHGPGALPVTLQDDFTDACDPDLERVYEAPFKTRTKLVPERMLPRALFGEAVSIDDDVIVVGAHRKSFGPGSAYVYRRTAVGWIKEQRLIASDGVLNDEFGRSVAVDGDTIVVGAPGDDDRGSDSGSAYVFTHTGGAWVERQKLVPGDLVRFAVDFFGWAVSIDDDTIVVGARYDDARGFNSGAAYAFRRTATGWVEEQELVASDGAGGDEFGFAVSVSGNTVVVGAPLHDERGPSSGSAFVFRRTASGWLPMQELTASDAEAYHSFGAALALDGSTLVVGVGRADGAAGSAYVFRRIGDTWTEERKLLASDRAPIDRFGSAVAVRAGTVIVGSPYDDDRSEDAGSAYVFADTGSGWTEEHKLAAEDAGLLDLFGTAAAVAGDTVVVGAPGDDDFSGSAYVHEGRQRDPTYRWHGDYTVLLRATDDSGNSASDSVSFTIDTVAPAVELLGPPERHHVPDDLPFDIVFRSSDSDHARGAAVHEVVKLEGCAIYDGAAYGNRDGLLTDERLVLTENELCRISDTCGFAALDRPEIRVEVTDCGGNRAFDSVTLAGSVALRPGLCEP